MPTPKYDPSYVILDYDDRVRVCRLFPLQLHIVAAENLQAADRNGLSDPYVVFRVEGSHPPSGVEPTGKTKVVKASLNPHWDQVFDLFVRDPWDFQIDFRLWDKDTLNPDDPLGMTVLSVASLVEGEDHSEVKSIETWLPISGATGRLLVRITGLPSRATYNPDPMVPTPNHARRVHPNGRLMFVPTEDIVVNPENWSGLFQQLVVPEHYFIDPRNGKPTTPVPAPGWFVATFSALNQASLWLSGEKHEVKSAYRLFHAWSVPLPVADGILSPSKWPAPPPRMSSTY